MSTPPGSKQPIRRDLEIAVTSDAMGNTVSQPIQGQETSLSPDGSIDRVTQKYLWFLHCGHSGDHAAGGRCAEQGCGNISCSTCFEAARCRSCAKPLCLEHSFRFTLETSEEIRVCRRCRDELKRKRLFSLVKNTLLTLFLGTDKTNS